MLPWQTDIVRDTANGSGMPVIVTAVYFTLLSNSEATNMLACSAYLTVIDDKPLLYGLGQAALIVMNGSLSGRKKEFGLSLYYDKMIDQMI
jgi:hypothetical protein